MGRRKTLHRCLPDVAKPLVKLTSEVGRSVGSSAEPFLAPAGARCSLGLTRPRVLASTTCLAGSASSAVGAASPSLAGSCARRSPKEDFVDILRMFEDPRHRSVTDIMAAFGLKAIPSLKSKDGAPPRQVLKALAAARANGVNISSLADGVVERPFMCKIAATSTDTYASHLRMIGWACDLFGHEPLGCTVQQVRRVAAVCVCASTQRGWLSAWAMAHQISGRTWVGMTTSYFEA